MVHKATQKSEKNFTMYTVETDVPIIEHGLVAQLGERRVRNAEVEGSIPFESTKKP